MSAFEGASPGEWESFEDCAAQLAEDCGTFDSVPEEVRQCVDDGTALIHLPDYDDGDYLIEPDDAGLFHLYELGWCFLEARD